MTTLTTQQIQSLSDIETWEIVHYIAKPYNGVYYYVEMQVEKSFLYSILF